MDSFQNFPHIIDHYSDNEDDANEIDVNETSDIDDEPDDSSLKDIYSGQTFTTFEVLESCLKNYAKRTGFEIRTVRSEKEDDKWARKTSWRQI